MHRWGKLSQVNFSKSNKIQIQVKKAVTHKGIYLTTLGKDEDKGKRANT